MDFQNILQFPPLHAPVLHVAELEERSLPVWSLSSFLLLFRFLLVDLPSSSVSAPVSRPSVSQISSPYSSSSPDSWEMMTLRPFYARADFINGPPKLGEPYLKSISSSGISILTLLLLQGDFEESSASSKGYFPTCLFPSS